MQEVFSVGVLASPGWTLAATDGKDMRPIGLPAAFRFDKSGDSPNSHIWPNLHICWNLPHVMVLYEPEVVRTKTRPGSSL